MKMLFIANIEPMEIIDKLKLSVAGTKFVLSICKEFDKLLGSNNFDIVSWSRNKAAEKLCGDKIWGDKKYFRVKSARYPILLHIIQGLHFVEYLLKWTNLNKSEKKVIVLLNSPAHIAIPLVILKNILNLKIFSITIDTPFTKDNSFNGVLGLYNKLYFKAGHLALKGFTGILVLNKNAVDCLKLRIPYFVFLIGYDEDTHINSKAEKKQSEKRKLAYAGTFTYSKGTSQLLEAFVLLGDSYELHMYGYGTLEEEIKKYSHKYTNIILHGRVDYNILLEGLKNMDLLISPSLTCDYVKSFSFPSKIVEYILTGRPVLTTIFPNLPPEYLNFVHLIEEETPIGIKKSIEKVFNYTQDELQEKCIRGVKFVTSNQNYKVTIEQMYDFINSAMRQNKVRGNLHRR